MPKLERYDATLRQEFLDPVNVRPCRGARVKIRRCASGEGAMLGGRFTAVYSTIVAGTMIVAMGAWTATQASRGTPGKPATTERPTADHSRRIARHRHGVRHSHLRAADHSRRIARHRHGLKRAFLRRPARQVTERSAPSALPTPPDREPSTAERRFREFISARLLAANPVEDLRGPRLEVSHFSRQTAYPVVDTTERPIAEASDPARVNAEEEGKDVDLALTGVQQQTNRVAQPVTDAISEMSPKKINEIRSSDRDTPNPWVRLVFVSWGGLLTLGSALRMLIG